MVVERIKSISNIQSATETLMAWGDLFFPLFWSFSKKLVQQGHWLIASTFDLQTLYLSSSSYERLLPEPGSMHCYMMGCMFLVPLPCLEFAFWRTPCGSAVHMSEYISMLKGWGHAHSAVSVSTLIHTVEPWTTQVWTVWAHFYLDFFSINTYSVLHDSQLVRSPDAEPRI